MYHFNLFLPDRQIDGLRRLSVNTELPVAELMRRMFDYCCRRDVLDELVPTMSGQLYLVLNGRK